MIKEKAIIIKGLSKKYYKNDASQTSIFSKIKNRKNKESFYALKDINLEITRGELIGIIGPNGAGKSTLLKVIAEVTPPSEGTIEIHGKVASILEIGIGFQPELSGYENIFLSGELYGLSRNQIKSKIDLIINMFGFSDFINTEVKHYSSGMYMRLAFSIIINIEADIYLFDEILSVGDINFQSQALNEIKKLKDKNATILIVSHNLKQIDTLCNKLCLFTNGELTHEGDPYTTGLKYIGKSKNPEIRSSNYSISEFPIELQTGLNILNTNKIIRDNQILINFDLKTKVKKAYSTFRLVINKCLPSQTICLISKDLIIDPISGEFTLSLKIDSNSFLNGTYVLDFFATDESKTTASLINIYEFEINNKENSNNKYWIIDPKPESFEIEIYKHENIK